MRNQNWSEEFKKAVVEKLLSRGTRPTASILEEVGIASGTVYRWKANFAKTSGMNNKAQSPQDRSSKEKLNSLIEYENLPMEQRGEFLRKKGLHEEHLQEWRKQIEEALQPINKKAEREERAQDRRKILELEKDLKRKNSALAETTALLVLKKKADLIWGTREDA
jgi:transposase-like protein